MADDIVEDDEEAKVQAEGSAETLKESDLLDLHSGEHFTNESASEILRNQVSRVIVLAGSIKSGKTTLLNSIYEAFNKGEFANYQFAGSKTLVAFEERCHLARLNSGASQADTARTPRTGGSPLLHLKVKRIDSEVTRDILLTDFTGEFFREAMDSTEACKRLTVVKRADHFVLFLDCERLSRDDERPLVIEEGRVMCRSFLEANMLTKNSIVDIFFSKSDLLRTSNNAKLLDDIEKKYRKHLGDGVAKMNFATVVSKPLQKIAGIQHIFPQWVEDSMLFQYNKPESALVRSGREFNTFN